MTKKKLTLIIVFSQMIYALPGQMWVGSGTLKDGTPFWGIDEVRVINK